MTVRIGINGFGRIGRLAYRYATGFNDVEVVAINDLVPADQLAFLLAHDTVQGLFPLRGQGSVRAEGNVIQVLDAAGKVLRSTVVTAEKDPTQLKWDELKVDVVLECTGLFLGRDKAAMHYSGPANAGVKRVILSAPPKESDTRTVVLKVNHQTVTPDDRIVSNSSCTTNCIAPVFAVLHESFGVESAFFNTIHAYTNDQNVVDSPHKKDLRRARTAAANIIPTSTGADKAIMSIFPELKGKVKGFATRVPVPDGSVTDINFTVRAETTKEAVNAALQAAAEGKLKGILEFSMDPLVSSDIVGNPNSSIVDGQSTFVLGKQVRVFAWYDNEWGYSCRMIDLVRALNG
jgi:glyceraldehyde 3-phosphate dehydrogenase